ncbi:hypothetical protein F5B21DRAFT_529348 [Xylaria acuta]|nr:hypothetical protein F5B21DRAFT_529348 [Xylaria acuta]
MALKLRLQTPPFHLSSLSLEAEPQVPLTLTNIRRSGDISELQQKFSAVIKRVVGENTSCPSSPSASSTPSFSLSSPSSSSSPSSPPSSSPTSLSPSSLEETPPPPPDDDDDDDDVHSNYGEEEEEEEEETTLPLDPNTTTINPIEPTLSISISSPSPSPSPSSYASLASLNPYVLDAEDLARRLSLLLLLPLSPEPPREDRHGRDRARLARQLDRAHASVKAEECAALQILRRQTAASLA